MICECVCIRACMPYTCVEVREQSQVLGLAFNLVCEDAYTRRLALESLRGSPVSVSISCCWGAGVQHAWLYLVFMGFLGQACKTGAFAC